MTTAIDDGRALLAAILAESDNDAPRLEYSDWLEEQGEEARSSLIRVQIRLAAPWWDGSGECWQCWCARHGKQHTNGKCHCTQAWKAIRRRERELLEQHGAEWNGDFLRAVDVDPGVFGLGAYRRGFLWQLTGTAADWLAHADAITTAAPIREVVLATRPEWMDARGTVILYSLYSGRNPLRPEHVQRLCKSACVPAQVVGRLNSDILQEILDAEWRRIKFTLPPPD